MIKSREIVFCIMFMLGIVTICAAKDWRGIKPLRSTRNDVVRLLGPSPIKDRVRSIYQLPNEEVLILFSGGQFCNPKTTKVPFGTVLLVQVTPRSKHRLSDLLSDLQIDRTRLREFSPSSQDPDWKGFIDVEEGFLIRVYKDYVDEIYYIAAARDQSRCPSYYADPESLARIVVDFISEVFDEYSALAFMDEKARLDNFAIYLQKEKPNWKGYIIAYSDKNGMTDARSRSNRAREYLISLGVDNSRIAIIMGGARGKFTVQLYALPPDLPAPRPRNHHRILRNY